MRSETPSRTAWAAAAHRAAHQVLEQGRIFPDPVALRILGEDAASVVRDAQADPSKRRMRIFIAARARFAEDALAAVERCVSQVVVLGAGLDTFAYRSLLRDGLRIFEVDHPATQAWKRERLQKAVIPVPSSLIFAPIDFEGQTLPEGLADAGFDPGLQTFFSWIGVVPYLTENAIWSTLEFIAGLSGGAHMVFDYSDPPETLSAEARALRNQRAAHVEEAGEAWLTHFEADKLAAKLMSLGFSEIEDLGPTEIAARYFPSRVGAPLEDRGGHVLRASTHASNV